MSATTATLRGRRAAERKMIDRCVVRRPDTTQPQDESTGEWPMIQVYPDPSWPVGHPYAQGKAASQTYEGYERTPEAGGHSYTVQRYSAHLPATAPQIEVGDVIEWTVCPNDPSRVGTQEQVTAPFGKTFKTAQRVFVDRTAVTR